MTETDDVVTLGCYGSPDSDRLCGADQLLGAIIRGGILEDDQGDLLYPVVVVLGACEQHAQQLLAWTDGLWSAVGSAVWAPTEALINWEVDVAKRQGLPIVVHPAPDALIGCDSLESSRT